jgi:hypothetical protein
MTIVERLRGWVKTNQHPDSVNDIMQEAVNEIERLREALERLAAFDGKAGGVVAHMASIARAALIGGA